MQQQNTKKGKLGVVPFSTRHAIQLTAGDIVSIMRAANFTDEQIYEYGPQVRSALMTVGGVQIEFVRDKTTTVVVRFVINADDYVLVTSVASGYFVYDARNHQFGLRPSSSAQPPPVTTPVK